MSRTCKALNENGEPCGQAPLTGREFCFWHDPEFEKQAAEARRAGGAKRAREQSLKAIFDYYGVETIEDLRRVHDIATTDLLALENSVARNRALLSSVDTGLRLIEAGELTRQIEEIRRVLEPRLGTAEKKKRWWRQ